MSAACEVEKGLGPRRSNLARPCSPGYSNTVTGDVPHEQGAFDCAQRPYERYRITIPPNTMATVHLPVEGYAGTSESSKPVEQAEDIRFLSTDEGEPALLVGPGRYKVIGRVAQ